MIPQGIFTAAKSIRLDNVLYHLTLYRSGANYKAYFDCTKCGAEIDAEPVIAPDARQAMDAARQQAEAHHLEQHDRHAKKLAREKLVGSKRADLAVSSVPQ